MVIQVKRFHVLLSVNVSLQKMLSFLARRRKHPIQEEPLVSTFVGQGETYLDDAEDYSRNTEEAEHLNTPTNSNFALHKGIFYSTLSSVLFSTLSVIVKYEKDISVSELSLARFVGIFAFNLPFAIHSGKKLFGPRRASYLLILRGVLGATSLYLRFVAFRYLPIADASVIMFSVPVFSAVVLSVFLKERCGLFQTFTVIVTLIGLALIAKLPVMLTQNAGSHFDRHHVIGITTAVISMLLTAATCVVIQKVKSVHQSVILFHFGLVASLEMLVISLATHGIDYPDCGAGRWLMIFVGLFSFCGQMLVTLALKTEQAIAVAIVRSVTDIVLAFMWEIWFFREVPDSYSISGAVLVCSCVALVGMRKWIMNQPHHSPVRKKIYLLTL